MTSDATPSVAEAVATLRALAAALAYDRMLAWAIESTTALPADATLDERLQACWLTAAAMGEPRAAWEMRRVLDCAGVPCSGTLCVRCRAEWRIPRGDRSRYAVELAMPCACGPQVLAAVPVLSLGLLLEKNRLREVEECR